MGERPKINIVAGIFVGAFIACIGQLGYENGESGYINNHEQLPGTTDFDSTIKTIHVFVALCDNKYQGIVPVPSKMGNGQDPDNNLYWGWGYGVRTHFKRSKEWKLIRAQPLNQVIMERLVFKHVSRNYYLVADAYDGRYIKNCTMDFLKSTSGQIKDTLTVNGISIGVYGNAVTTALIGHNGLMDFQLEQAFNNTDGKQRDCIILACISKSYFSPYIAQAKAKPLLWTTGLMGPEAYTLHDALTGYVNNESGEQVRTRAAQAYSKYTKCSIKAARNLLVSGW